MAYRFRKSEGLGVGTRRIARELVDHAVKIAESSSLPTETQTHEARKAVKKLRALLRLVRPAIETASNYKKSDKALRDAARVLSDLRDDDVMKSTLTELVDATDGARTLAKTSKITKALATADGQANGSDRRAALREYARRMQEIRAGIDEWNFTDRSLGGLEAGYKATFRRSRKLMRKALESPTDRRFHAWRKEVKYHHYHARLLANLRGAPMHKRSRITGELQERLGQHHDLAVLRKRLDASKKLRKSDAASQVRKRVKREIREIVAGAEAMGREILSDDAKLH